MSSRKSGGLSGIQTNMSKKEYIKINKKIIPGIIVLLPLIGILISKHRPGEMLLLLLGVGVGIYIGRVSVE
jgi:hypothetical protein